MCNYLNIPYDKIDIKKNNSKEESEPNSKSNSDNWKLYYDKYPHTVNIVKEYYKNDFINFNYDLYIPMIKK